MKFRAEDLIGKCIEGRAARDVIRSIEEDIPDALSVRAHLIKDLRSAGLSLSNREVVAERTCIKIATTEELTEESRSILRSVCDTYARTYPEIEVLVALSVGEAKI